MTRATTAATSTSKPLNVRNAKESPTAKEPQGKVAEKAVTEDQQPAPNTGHAASPLQKIATAIGQIISKENLDNSTKQSLEDVLTFIRGEREKEGQTLTKTVATAEESTIRKSIRKDLVEIYDAIKKQLNGI